jgi:hypothetical protein
MKEEPEELNGFVMSCHRGVMSKAQHNTWDGHVSIEGEGLVGKIWSL